MSSQNTGICHHEKHCPAILPLQLQMSKRQSFSKSLIFPFQSKSKCSKGHTKCTILIRQFLSKLKNTAHCEGFFLLHEYKEREFIKYLKSIKISVKSDKLLDLTEEICRNCKMIETLIIHNIFI